MMTKRERARLIELDRRFHHLPRDFSRREWGDLLLLRNQRITELERALMECAVALRLWRIADRDQPALAADLRLLLDTALDGAEDVIVTP